MIGRVSARATIHAAAPITSSATATSPSVVVLLPHGPMSRGITNIDNTSPWDAINCGASTVGR